MTALPDIFCYVKALDQTNGKAIPDGGLATNDASVVVRYVMANDSDLPMGPFTVTGSLWQDGVKINPNPIPALHLTLQPNELLKREFSIPDTSSTHSHSYVAKILGDIGNFVNEEDEKNNLAKLSFTVPTPPA